MGRDERMSDADLADAIAQLESARPGLFAEEHRLLGALTALREARDTLRLIHALPVTNDDMERAHWLAAGLLPEAPVTGQREEQV